MQDVTQKNIAGNLINVATPCCTLLPKFSTLQVYVRGNSPKNHQFSSREKHFFQVIFSVLFS